MGRERIDVPGPFNFLQPQMNTDEGRMTEREPFAVLSVFHLCSSMASRPRTSLCSRVSKTQLVWGSTTAACQIVNRKSQIINLMGPWLKSEAPALQAVLSGSVTRRTPPTPSANSQSPMIGRRWNWFSIFAIGHGLSAIGYWLSVIGDCAKRAGAPCIPPAVPSRLWPSAAAAAARALSYRE